MASETNVPIFEFDGWACDWNPDTPNGGLHIFSKAGAAPIYVRSNAAWAPGDDPVQWKRALLPRFWLVQRTRLERLMPIRYRPYGNTTNGADVGGYDIWLHPRWRGPETLEIADRIMERHAIAAFHRHTGAPLTRLDMGMAGEYAMNEFEPSWLDANPNDITQLAPFRTPAPSGHKQRKTRRIASSHLIRAYGRDVAAFKARRDPVARMRLIVQAYDVMNSFPPYFLEGEAAKQTFYGSMAAMERNVRDYPRLARLGGDPRWLAWAIRAVAEAYRALEQPNRMMEDFLRKAINTMAGGQAENGTLADNRLGDGMEQDAPWTHDGLGFNLGFRRLLPNEGECPSWQMPFALRALYEAARVLKDPFAEIIVASIVARWTSVITNNSTVAPQYGGVPGLYSWLVVSRDNVFLERVGPEGIRKAEPRYDPDVLAIAVRLGQMERVPEFWDRFGEFEDMADVYELRGYTP